MTSAGLIARAAGPAELELTSRGDAHFQRVREGIGRRSRDGLAALSSYFSNTISLPSGSWTMNQGDCGSPAMMSTPLRWR
jgi:hypothetical protein